MPTARHIHGDKRERSYTSHADRDFSVDHPDTDHDRQRRHAEREKDRKEDRDKRDREWDEKDIEHDSGDLDEANRRHKFQSRRMDDSVAEPKQQRGDCTENIGTYSISVSSSDDKNALKSKPSEFLTVNPCADGFLEGVFNKSMSVETPSQFL
ncbi:hypothetical protein BHE74_00003911 [Ensete ventricosum]|nr:hypothetical protein BHE74_00003911 [Ensete ventricosum]RZR81510.1 hypothetical protein BHM03_00007757 [Ensete ventricosum]